jgi:hypothetical protein
MSSCRTPNTSGERVCRYTYGLLEPLTPLLPRFLLVAGDHDYLHSAMKLFSLARAIIRTDFGPNPRRRVEIMVMEAISHRCLFFHLLRIPFRQSAKDASAPPALPVLDTIFLLTERSGEICGSEYIKPHEMDWSHHSPISSDGFQLRWKRPRSRKRRDPAKLAGTKRLVTTFFGLLRIAGYANSLNPECKRLHEDDEPIPRIVCNLFTDQLAVVGEEVSCVNRELYENSKTALKHPCSIRGSRPIAECTPPRRLWFRRLRPDIPGSLARYDESHPALLPQSPRFSAQICSFRSVEETCYNPMLSRGPDNQKTPGSLVIDWSER